MTPSLQLGFAIGVFLANHLASTDNLTRTKIVSRIRFSVSLQAYQHWTVVDCCWRSRWYQCRWVGWISQWSKGWWRWWWQLDYWSYKSCKAPVKFSPPTNQHPVFFTGQMPFLSPNQQCQSTEGIWECTDSRWNNRM